MSLESGRYMETVGKNAISGLVLPTDSYFRMDEYVFLMDSFIHPRFLIYYIGTNLDQGSSDKNLTISRRYLDPNRATYEVIFCSSMEVMKHFEYFE